MSDTSFSRLIYHSASQGDESDQFESRGAVTETRSGEERMSRTVVNGSVEGAKTALNDGLVIGYWSSLSHR